MKIYFLRYINILPYNHNRVHLSVPIKSSDYINASWIKNDDLADKLPTFIAAQGPLPHTIPHFLQMIVENKVKIIVMLTNLKEKNPGKIDIFLFRFLFVLNRKKDQLIKTNIKNY